MKRRTLLQSLLLGTSATASFIGSTSGSLAAPASSSKANLKEEIEAVLRETEAIWDSQDTARLRDLWDLDDPDPFYLAGEQENWFVGWEAINNYLAPPKGTPQVTQAIRVRFYDVQVRLLAPDLAFAGYWMRTDMKLVFSPKPFGSDNRVGTIFRKKADGWRYVCYTEAFQAPNLYFQKLFEKDVSQDYQEFFDRTTKER